MQIPVYRHLADTKKVKPCQILSKNAEKNGKTSNIEVW